VDAALLGAAYPGEREAAQAAGLRRRRTPGLMKVVGRDLGIAGARAAAPVQ